MTTNSMYEAGIAWINSAGNNGHPDPDDCTVGRGAAAIGALAVNAIRVEDDPPMSPFLDNIETMADKSSQGGNGSLTGDAYGRSVVAFASYTGHNLRAEGQASANPQYSDVTQRFGITSASAPTAAGAAALFRQWYKAEQSDLIDDPGIMYAQLHLMTDGLVDLPTEAYDLIGFDGLYGGGRLRLRAFDPDGLDAPGGWAAGSVCVAHGTTANVDLNAGSALSAGVDYIKAVTWTYDHDHDDSPGAGHDRFSLTLGYHNGSAWVEAVTDASNDNKHRVFVDDAVGGKPWRLRISGVAVNSDNEGCGTDANRVYYAIVFEDNARDDDTTLSTFVRPEPGVGY